MGKPTICIEENKGADQLHVNRKADQRHCFRYSDSTIPLLLKSEISSFMLFSVLEQVGLYRTCSETTLLVFPRGGSYVIMPPNYEVLQSPGSSCWSSNDLISSSSLAFLRVLNRAGDRFRLNVLPGGTSLLSDPSGWGFLTGLLVMVPSGFF